jgi:asparagine synthase (glutamine-hydrolysing)
VRREIKPENIRIDTQGQDGRQWIALSGFALASLPCSLSVETLQDLRGSHCVAWLGEGNLTIARDAVGTQSLFHGRVGERWLAATEPKAITCQPGFSRRIRPGALAQYLAFSFVPGEGTMLEDLWEVPAGHAVTFGKTGEPRLTRYFFFEHDEFGHADPSTCRDESHWIQATRDTIQEAVSERIATGAERAVFLSGGLDSSIVAAELAAQSSARIKTFAIHFGTKYPNELEFARLVARHIGSDHEEVLIRPRSFPERLRRMIWHLDEPIGDPITQPNFELAAHVSRYTGSVFNGEGGDPLFGGPKNLPMMLTHWYGVPRAANFREQAYLASYRRAYEECEALFTNEFRAQIDLARDLESLLTPYFRCGEPRSFLNKLMAINIRLKGAHLILPKVDRMLAASGMTPMSPLFDDRLTRLSFAMPPRMKLRDGVEKWVLKRAYEHLLPREIIDRPKSGMRVPVYHWFQRELRTYVKRILAPRRITAAGIFDSKRMQQLIRYDAEEGASRFGIRLWMLMTFEIWRRIVVEREPL